MKHIHVFSFILLVAMSIMGMILYVQNKNTFSASQTNYSTYASTTTYVVGPSTNGTVLLVPTSTERVWLRIVATSSNVFLDYSEGAPYSLTNREFLVSPLVLDMDHMYTGSIYAKADATTTVSVTEFKKWNRLQ